MCKTTSFPSTVPHRNFASRLSPGHHKHNVRHSSSSKTDKKETSIEDAKVRIWSVHWAVPAICRAYVWSYCAEKARTELKKIFAIILRTGSSRLLLPVSMKCDCPAVLISRLMILVYTPVASVCRFGYWSFTRTDSFDDPAGFNVTLVKRIRLGVSSFRHALARWKRRVPFKDGADATKDPEM